VLEPLAWCSKVVFASRMLLSPKDVFFSRHRHERRHVPSVACVFIRWVHQVPVCPEPHVLECPADDADVAKVSVAYEFIFPQQRHPATYEDSYHDNVYNIILTASDSEPEFPVQKSETAEALHTE